MQISCDSPFKALSVLSIFPFVSVPHVDQCFWSARNFGVGTHDPPVKGSISLCVNIKTHNWVKCPTRSVHLKNRNVFQNLPHYFIPQLIQIRRLQNNPSFRLKISDFNYRLGIRSRSHQFRSSSQNKSDFCLRFKLFQSFLFDSCQKRLGIKGLIFWRFDSVLPCETFQSWFLTFFKL